MLSFNARKGYSQEWEIIMHTDSRRTLARGISAIESKRKEIDAIVGLIANLIKPTDIKGDECIIQLVLGSSYYWRIIKMAASRQQILVQCRIGDSTLSDSMSKEVSADHVEEVWDALRLLETGVQQEIPAMVARLAPFFQAGRNVEAALLEAAGV